MNIDIITSNGSPIELVRFFRKEEKQYLLFKDDISIDEGGHVTIRISEIESMTKTTANAITDDNWDNTKNIIKNIVNMNKNNQSLEIEDLDYNSLEGIEILGYKSLKLMSNYVDLLKANQPFFDKKSMDDDIYENSKNINENFGETFDNVDNLNTNLNMFNIGEQPGIIEDNIALNTNLSVGEEIDSNANVSNLLHLEMNDNNIEVNSNFIQDSNVFENQNGDNQVNDVNYQQLYIEQKELINQLQFEIETYKNKIENLKSIINS